MRRGCHNMSIIRSSISIIISIIHISIIIISISIIISMRAAHLNGCYAAMNTKNMPDIYQLFELLVIAGIARYSQVVVVERVVVVVVVVWCCLPYDPVYCVMDGWTHHSIPTNMLGRNYW